MEGYKKNLLKEIDDLSEQQRLSSAYKKKKADNMDCQDSAIGCPLYYFLEI